MICKCAHDIKRHTYHKETREVRWCMEMRCECKKYRMRLEVVRSERDQEINA